jgi:lipopolysaccharide export system permease protein
MMRLLDKHVLREVWVPFWIGILTFAVILLGDTARRISATLVNPQISTLLVLKFLLYRAPSALVWSLPVGTLLGVCMAVNRLTREGEITAVRAGAIGFPRTSGSLLFFGALASLGAFALDEYLVPRTNRTASELYAKMTMTQPFMRDESHVLFKGGQNRIYYIQDMNARARQLTRVMIVDFDPEMRPIQFTLAERAQGVGEDWTLLDVFVERFDAEGRPTPEGAQHFDSLKVDLGAALRGYIEENRSEFEMGAVELRKVIKDRGSGGQDIHRLAVEYHFKYAIPAACFVFALIGAPLSFRTARHGGFMGILLAILIVFLYNGVRSWTRIFGLAGILDPAFAAWLQNVLFGTVGLYWLWKWQ